MNPNGIARTDIEIVDLSVLINTGLKGINGVLGVTERGEVDKPVLVGSWIEYVREFGGLRTDSDFPLLCRRALEAGAKLMVSRVGHYTTISDKTTLTGAKATLTKTTSLAIATKAVSTVTVTNIGVEEDTITISLGDVVLGVATVPVPDPTNTTTIIANVLTAAINGNTLTTGFTAVQTGNQVAVSGTLLQGDTLNGQELTIDLYGAVVATATAFAGGVTGSIARNITFEAKNIGDWGNAIKVGVTPAFSGIAEAFDISVDIAGYPDQSQVVKNVAKLLNSTQLEVINNQLKYVSISTLSEVFAFTASSLTGGAQDISTIVVADYIGDVVAQNGIHAFDNVPEITKIAAPEMAMPALDAALANYADTRGDIIALLRTPVGLDGAAAVDYREGTGAYSHQPIDTWRAFMFTGDLRATDPSNNTIKEITSLGDMLGIISTRDNRSKEWFSFSGSKRGRIKNALGVIYNLGTPARQATADLVDARGLNMIIDHPSFGIVSWGNSTLQKEQTLLKHANVAELIIFLVRGLKPLIQSELFNPNDIETWRAIYRKVQPFMDTVKSGRGVWDWLYQGDQDIDRLEDMVVNTPEGVDAGKYEFNLFVKPKVAMKYVGLKVAVSNSGVSFELLTNTNLD